MIEIKCAHLPVASNDLQITVVSSQGNVESNDSLAGLDEVEPLLIDVGLGGARLEEELDLFEETWFSICIKVGTSCFDWTLLNWHFLSAVS